MQRRNFPSILLYGFGLALALSLGFNGFLLYDQSRQRSMYESELISLVHPADLMIWQQQLSDCKRSNQQKDSLIVRLEHTFNVPTNQPVTVQRTPAK
ncbi:hypothetical protein GCM10028805_47660 [Spirosoma harenae]